MADTQPVRVFIGSGEASRLERKVLIHSLRKSSRSPLDIHVFNGTHNAVERNDGPPRPVPLSLRVKYRNVTEFSNYRFLIPELCGFEGRAIWVDSDTICLADIADLFHTPLDGADFLAKADAYQSAHWGLSVMLIDCGKCRFDVERYFHDIDRGLYASADLHQMTPRFLQHHPFTIGKLDPSWNSFDYWDGGTKLIHYTNLLTQPWKYPGHPYGELWFQYLHEAMREGAVTAEDVELSKLRAYVRQDLLNGNGASARSFPFSRGTLRRAAGHVRRALRELTGRGAAV